MRGLYIPAPHTIHKRAPTKFCTICKKPFYENEQRALERHVLNEHSLEEILQHSPRHTAPGLFDPYWEGGDVDWQRWIDKNKVARPEAWRRWMKTGAGKSSGGLGDG